MSGAAFGTGLTMVNVVRKKAGLKSTAILIPGDGHIDGVVADLIMPVTLPKRLKDSAV